VRAALPGGLVTLVSQRGAAGPGGLVALVAAAARSGVDFIQVREKDLADRALCALVGEVLEAVRGASARVLVNGRPGVASLAGAAGVQLPEQGLPVGEVRRHFPGLLLGVSCHSLEAARAAADDGADFVLLGPVFPTPGKEGHTLGLGPVAAAARALRLPVHAIGGIDGSNARTVLEAGAAGVAAIRAFLPAAGPELVRALKGQGA